MVFSISNNPFTLCKISGWVQYEYVDLWSRHTTWGGNPPPGPGDSVVIPAGTFVLLDISPPPLVAILIQGTLKFDDTQQVVALQACHIPPSLMRLGSVLTFQ